MVSLPGRIFLLSPAKAGGPRYSMLTREQADFDVARRLREGAATIGEVYSFRDRRADVMRHISSKQQVDGVSSVVALGVL
jgi:hypothetical protein